MIRDLRKALSLGPVEAARRLAGRAVRYARRVRQRRRPARLSDADLLAALAEPAATAPALIARRRERQPLLPGAAAAAATAERLRREAPGACAAIVEAARAAAEGVFDLLGSGPVRLGPNPDWHADFKSGRRWEPVYSLGIVPEYDRGSDPKVPWELSRLQHLPALGIASALSGDPSFRERGVARLAAFVAANPAYRGINWSGAMDVAIRAAQILAAEGFLRGPGDERAWIETIKSLLLHARFVRANLEDGPVRGNHYVANLAGLYLCGLGLPEFREAAGWSRFAAARLVSEIERQVGSDGLHFEASLSYHAFATGMFLVPALLAAARGRPFPRPYLERLRGMVGAVAVLVRPDGSLPQIGDNDDGRFLVVSQYHRHRRDWRPLLALGAYLFDRADWLAQAGDAWVEGAWVLGESFLRWKDAARAPAAPSGFACRAFPAGGIYLMGGGGVQMVVDAGGVGQDGNGAHAHNDTLAFDLYAHGREVLPDRGTGVYGSDLAARDRFRSTRAHNTVRVDGEEINPLPDEPFRLIPADSPRVLAWREGERRVFLRAEHSGFRRGPGGVVHRRSIVMDRGRGAFLIEDRLDGRGRHRYTASFHLAPGWGVTIGDGGWEASGGPAGPILTLRWAARPPGLRVRVEDDLHSPSYGVMLPARTVRAEWEGEPPCRLRYALAITAGAP